MKVCILNIGYELLQGRVINTNASYLARKLTLLGHDVQAQLSVGDREEDIHRGLKACIELFDSELIITTGGLGTTPDDQTIPAIATFFGLELVINEEALREVDEKYRRASLSLTQDRLKLAKLPRNAAPIPNPVGIAPGMWLETSYGGKRIIVVSLPGVPKEMEAMFEHYVEPRIRGSKTIVEAEIEIGIRESDATPLIRQIMKKFPSVYVKSHPLGHELENPSIRLYVAVYDTDSARAKEVCHEVINEVLRLFASHSPTIVKECTSPT